MSDSERHVHCPYCDRQISPGHSVVSVGDSDPWRDLWHLRCREMWEYDQELAEKMGLPVAPVVSNRR